MKKVINFIVICRQYKKIKNCINNRSCNFFVGKEYPGFSSGEFGKDKSNYRKYGEQIVVTSIAVFKS